MRHTEFWARMEEALGAAYARHWAGYYVIRDLGGRTARRGPRGRGASEGGLASRVGSARAPCPRPMTTIDARVDVATVQRRTIGTLVTAQAVGAVGITIGIATASLLAEEVSGSERQAGLAQTFQVLGAAVMAYILARIMSRRGRRVGLVTGYVTGSAGAVLVVVAGVVDSMTLLLVGAAMLGSSTAANSAARYAATDLAPAATRARALSVVVWATTIGAVAGPNLTGLSASVADRLGIPELTGPFALASVGMLAAALVIGVLLRPDPLLTARAVAAEAAPVLDPDGSASSPPTPPGAGSLPPSASTRCSAPRPVASPPRTRRWCRSW